MKFSVYLLCLLVYASSLTSMQQQVITKVRPDILINQSLTAFDKQFSWKQQLMIMGASVGVSALLYAYTHSRQIIDSKRHHNNLRANDAYLLQQREITPHLVPIFILMARQKPQFIKTGDPRASTQQPIGTQIAKHIASFIETTPQQTLTTYKKCQQQYEAEYAAQQESLKKLKTFSLGIPLATWAILCNIRGIRNAIHMVNNWVITPPLDAVTHITSGEYRKAMAPSFWFCVSCLYLYTRYK